MNEKTEIKNRQQAELFKNRLSKNFKNLKKWARKNRISCYRLYDKDIPEIPLALDIYTFLPDDIETKEESCLFINKKNQAIAENSSDALYFKKQEAEKSFLVLYLYERPYEKDEKEEEIWLDFMALAACEVIGIKKESLIIKRRRKQSDGKKREQYEKNSSSKNIFRLTQEQGQLFLINLEDYLDTGLFFDHRPLRKAIRDFSKAKSVLNLFCYTGSFSVYAAEGGAKKVTSVDMSKTYLDWAKENMKKNAFTDENKYLYIRQDVTSFLDQMTKKALNQKEAEFFDIIILDPPTFSNSKKTENTLDINRDWSQLVKKCISLLTPKGILYFSTNSKKLSFDESLLPLEIKITDITGNTIPEDYRNKKIHRCWKIENL